MRSSVSASEFQHVRCDVCVDTQLQYQVRFEYNDQQKSIPSRKRTTHLWIWGGGEYLWSIVLTGGWGRVSRGFRYPPKNEHGTRDTYPIPRTWDQEPGRDLAPDTRHTLSPFPGEHLWKHSLPPTSSAGGKNSGIIYQIIPDKKWTILYWYYT